MALSDHEVDTIAFFVNVTNSLFTWTNVRCLWRDKLPRGTNIWTNLYFACGSCWSCYFTIHFKASHAFIGSMLTAAGNFTWFALAFYYSKIKPNQNK